MTSFQMQLGSIHSLAAGKKVVLFAVSGAFTPPCSLPGFIDQFEELKSNGVDEIICLSVNDNKHVKFLADGVGKYTQALGLELDLSAKGLGVRSKRYALLVEDLEVKVANIESEGEFTIFGADKILKAL